MARATARPRGDRSAAPRAATGRRVRWGWLAFTGFLVAAVVAGLLYLSGGRSAGGAALSTLRTADFHALAFSPGDANVVYFGHHNGLMRSDDGGRTWQAVVQQRNFDAMGLGVGRGSPRQVYAAGHDVFFASPDGGATWQPVANDLPGTDIHGFAMSPDDPNRLYAFVVNHGVFRSDDGGRHWAATGGRVPPDVMGLSAAGGTPEILYAGSMSSGVLRSTDGGRSWSETPTSPGSQGAYALAVDPAAGQTVYAGVDVGLYKTTDGGATWAKLPFPGRNVVGLAISPSDPRIVLAIAQSGREGLVYRSDDGGASWGSGR